MKQGQVTVERVFDALCVNPADLTDVDACVEVVVRDIDAHPRTYGGPVMPNDHAHVRGVVEQMLTLFRERELLDFMLTNAKAKATRADVLTQT